MLTVVVWKWHTPDYRSEFTSERVNVLARMVKRHYPHPHEVVCVTDDWQGLDSAIRPIPDVKDFAHVSSPHDAGVRARGKKNPSCYRRLRLYHPDAAEHFGGDRLLSLDIDSVITGDLSPLWNRPEDVVLWGDNTNPQPGSLYNGSMQLVRAGSRPQVWTEFNPATSPAQALRAGAWGSDQGWLSYKLPCEARWTKADGVYSYRNDLQRHGRLSANCRIVFFHGSVDPWHAQAQYWPWVQQAYR